MIDTIIFDMDGVITTEEKYWACARLTLWEFITQTLALPDAFPNAVLDADARQIVIPDDLIYALKGRAVNSNWDVTFVLVCAWLAALPGARAFSAHTPQALIDTLQTQAQAAAFLPEWPHTGYDLLAQTPLEGLPLVEFAGSWAALALGTSGLMEPEGAFWRYLQERFQRFYMGEVLRAYGGAALRDGTALPVEALQQTLQALRNMNITLGVATGRPLDELHDALDSLDLMRYFDGARLGTYDKVIAAQHETSITGLAKPHPYSLLYALYPSLSPRDLLAPDLLKNARPNVAVIGDAPGDMQMAKAAGCHAIGVLTGVQGDAAKAERREKLISAGAETILPDMTFLPEYFKNL